ncbi:MAG: SurA N-terminal domain-containing protein [Spirochaetia bacterium]|jgi:peptidyl-prolyl cis-trans isomerase D|nr:SurA N-terminal domain-containing protein [Spirochaetia bacterium]
MLTKDKNIHPKELNSVDRKKKRHPFLWVFSITILVIIVISFIGGPLLGGLGGSSSELVFGKYGDKEISYSYGTYFSRQLDIMQNQYESNGSDNYQYETYQIWKGAFDRTVFHTAILHSADLSGLNISDRQIDKALTQYGSYMDNGKFSAALYNATSNADRYSNRTIYNEELIQQQYLQDIGDRLIATDELNFIKNMSKVERNFRYIAFPIAEYPIDEVIKYGQANNSLFRKVDLSRISLKDNEKEAITILAQLNENPAVFEERAQNHSTDFYADKGGDMGQVTYFSLSSDISDSKDIDNIFALEKGDISQLIKTPYGYSIYRCNSISQDSDLTNETEQENVLNYMMTNEKGMIEDYFVAQAGIFRTAAIEKGFTETSVSMNLNYYLTDFFPINYGNSYFLKQVKTIDESRYFDTVATDERFFTSLFSLQGNELTEPAIVGNAILVAQMISEQQITQEELSYLDSYYPYLLNQNQQIELSSTFVRSDLFTNNFISVFSNKILTN